MPITLVTGKPGAGKTLWTIGEVRALAQRENRIVYHDGIPELRVPGWLPLPDPLKWYELPHGSIILIDECQRIWRQRHSRSVVPEYSARLETHRHQGFDLFLLTQDPSLVDPHLRALVGRHVHVQRKFGMHQSMLWEWPDCKEKPLSYLKLAQSRLYQFDQSIFSLYKSADLHTVKRRLPSRVYIALALVILLPLMILAAGWYWYRNAFMPMAKKGSETAAKAAGLNPASPPKGQAFSSPTAAVAAPVAASPVDPLILYAIEREPLIPDLPHTAPRYQPLLPARSAPTPEFCLATVDRCTCYTSQITKIAMDPALCRSFAEGRNFRDWIPPAAPAARSASASDGASALPR